MLEQLFTYRGVLSRHREAPLVEERERYLATRAAVGLAPATLQNLAQALRIVAHTLTLPADGPLDTTAITMAADRWVQSQRHGQHVQDRQGPRRRFIRAAMTSHAINPVSMTCATPGPSIDRWPGMRKAQMCSGSCRTSPPIWDIEISPLHSAPAL